MSLVASIGICALVGVEITLIISEVIPFLTLAIGVDNMFIIVHSLGETSPVRFQPMSGGVADGRGMLFSIVHKGEW